MNNGSIMPTEELKPRELEVLQLIADGLSNKDIAERLHIAVTTVRWHNRQLYSKLGVHTRTKAVAHARQLGLLNPIPQQNNTTSNQPLNLQSNLPSQLTPFVGRVSEIAKIRQQLTITRLLTLIGPGGIGKTRLAVQVAQELLDFYSDGVWFVPLGTINTVDAIIPTIADTVRCQLFGRKNPTQQLHDFLRDKAMLIVLDNFEHFLDDVMIVRDMLNNAPHLKILVTSREKLKLHAETILVLGGLDFPETTNEPALEQFSAIQLFIQTAQRVNQHFGVTTADFPTLTAICRIVDGMPLGIELAATWVEVLSLAEIEAEIRCGIDFLQTTLRDIPERHHSIRSVFDATWKRLKTTEQAALAKLSVFQGSFTRQAAQQVSDASLLTLMVLVGKSLLTRTGNDRFQIHELLRRYMGEKLAKHGDHGIEAAQQAHATYFFHLLEDRKSDLDGHHQLDALTDIEVEFANIREAWLWAANHRRFDLILLAIDSLNLYCSLRSRYHEWLNLLQEVLVHHQQFDDVLHATLLIKLGRIQGSVGEHQKGITHIEQGLVIAHRINDVDRQAEALTRMGWIYCQIGDVQSAKPYVAEAKTIAQYTDNQVQLAVAFRLLGVISNNVGEYSQGKLYILDSLKIYEDMGDLFGVAHCLNLLGMNHVDRGFFDDAEQYCLESLTIQRQLRNQRGIAACLINLGVVAFSLNNHTDAYRYYTESLTIRRNIGDQWGIAACLGNMGLVTVDLAEAYRYQEESLNIFREIGSKRGVANALTNLGELAHKRSNYADAAQHFEEALSLYREISYLLGEASCLTGMGHLARVRSDYKQAWQYYCEALSGIEEPLPISLIALIGLAFIASEERYYVDAAQWIGLALNHSAADADVEKMANMLLEQLKNKMSSTELHTALEDGKALHFDEVVVKLLRADSQVIPSNSNGHQH